MNKFFTLLVGMVLLTGLAFGDGLSEKSGVVGLDLPTIGGINRNAKGEIVSTFGANIGLGISYKGYFSPVKTNQFNGWWGAGTVILILPYVGVGVDYVWDNGFYAGIGFPTAIQAGYLF